MFAMKKGVKLAAKQLMLGLGLLAGSQLLAAAEYTIQIGAFKNVDSSALQSAAEFGELTQAQAGEFTRVQVGRFSRISDAQDSLEGLRSIGFHDAFVTPVSASTEYVATDMSNSMAVDASHQESARVTTSSSTSRSSNRPSSGAYDGLSPEEQRSAVYLDGMLRMKIGDQFYSLEEYRSRF